MTYLYHMVTQNMAALPYDKLCHIVTLLYDILFLYGNITI